MKKIALILIGVLSVILGVIGIFLPILPTTPLILLAGYCFLKSSKRLYNKLIKNKYLGIYIKNYYEKKGIPKKTKTYVLCTLWISISITVIIINSIIIKIVILIVAVLVSIYILKQKTIVTN